MKKILITLTAFAAITATSCKKQTWCEYNCKWVHYTNGEKDYWNTTNGKIWQQSGQCRQSFVEEGSVTNSYSSSTGNSYTDQKECELK